MSQSDNEGKSSIAIPDASDEIEEKNTLKETINKEIINPIRKYPEVFSLIFAIISIIIIAKMVDDEWGPLKPIKIDLSEMEDYEERIVRVEAVVSDAYQPNSGVWLVHVTDDSINGTRLIFSNSLNFIPKTGDTLEITGEVSRYNGELEIITQANEVKRINIWGENNITLGDIANDPSYYEGKSVSIKTYVKSSPTTSYNTTSFTVGGTYNNLRIEINEEDFKEIYGEPVLIIGDYIELIGVLKFDTYWLSYEIILDEEGHKVELIS